MTGHTLIPYQSGSASLALSVWHRIESETIECPAGTAPSASASTVRPPPPKAQLRLVTFGGCCTCHRNPMFCDFLLITMSVPDCRTDATEGGSIMAGGGGGCGTGGGAATCGCAARAASDA
jgi:hypothetical protein